MKLIIAGSRAITDRYALLAALEGAGLISGEGVNEVVSGGAAGVDKLGEQWAEGRNIPIKRFPAEWSRHGRSAGFIRNAQMAEYADALLAVWDGRSRGTKHMIEAARKKGLKVWVFGG